MKSRNLKVAICIDPNGCLGKTSDQEYKEYVKEWKIFLKPHKPTFYRINSAYHTDIKPGTDLILFDYGGMGYGNDLGERNSQHLVQYCIDNPNTLALVVSSYTWNVYVKHIINEFQYEELPNLKVVDYLEDDKIIPDWFMKGIVPPESKKGNFCQLCRANMDELSRKDKSLKCCSECNKFYCSYCEWEKVVKGVDFICVDCGERHYESI